MGAQNQKGWSHQRPGTHLLRPWGLGLLLSVLFCPPPSPEVSPPYTVWVYRCSESHFQIPRSTWAQFGQESTPKLVAEVGVGVRGPYLRKKADPEEGGHCGADRYARCVYHSCSYFICDLCISFSFSPHLYVHLSIRFLLRVESSQRPGTCPAHIYEPTGCVWQCAASYEGFSRECKWDI